MISTYLSIGSNLGDRKKNITTAVKRLNDRCGYIASLSSLYRTEAWGFNTPDIFFNMAVELRTQLLPEELLLEILGIEKELGRDRKSSTYENRVLDIDILFYGNKIIYSPMLTIPHPFVHLRLFVLVPLAEIAPFLTHPVRRMTVETMLRECTDKSSVELIGSLDPLN